MKLASSFNSMCNILCNLLILGVPDAILEAVKMENKPLAVGERKGHGPGLYQLLGALIKCWANYGVYPIGEFNCTLLSITYVIGECFSIVGAEPGSSCHDHIHIYIQWNPSIVATIGE